MSSICNLLVKSSVDTKRHKTWKQKKSFLVGSNLMQFSLIFVNLFFYATKPHSPVLSCPPNNFCDNKNKCDH